MPHPRQTIRDAIKAILNATPGFEGRVDTTRSRPTSTSELPCIIIYTLQETSGRSSTGGGLLRTLNVGIEIRTASSGEIDDALDDLALVVERAMLADPRLGGLAIDTYLTATAVGLDGEGESRQAVATLSYTVLYGTDRTSL